MLPNQWYGAVEADRVGSSPLPLRRFGMDLVFWRDAEGRAVCMLDRCPHRGVKLSLGKVVGGDLQCHYHGFTFDGAGACTSMPCEGAGARPPRGMCAVTFPTTEAHGLVWVWWGDDRAERPPAPWFDDIPSPDAAWARMASPWPQQWVRSIESNFDGSHFLFVHGRLLPGIGALVDPVDVRLDGDKIDATLYIREEGSAGLSFRARYRPPNLTSIEVAGKVVGVVVDTPIDETTTWRYSALSQSLIDVPGLRWLVAWALLRLDWGWTQARQDLPVVETMEPRLLADGDHRLVRADAGIAAFHKVYRRLLREGAAQLEGLPPHVAHALERALRQAEGDEREVLEQAMFRRAAGLPSLGARWGSGDEGARRAPEALPSKIADGGASVHH